MHISKYFFVAITIMLLAAGCSTTGNTDNTNAANSNEVMSQENNTNGLAANANISVNTNSTMNTGTEKTFTVNASSFKFDPAEIRVKKGDTVTINLVNAGGLHDWVVDAFNAKTKQINSGATDTVTFVADKIGTFEYYCSVGNHRQMGMKGNLIVE